MQRRSLLALLCLPIAGAVSISAISTAAITTASSAASAPCAWHEATAASDNVGTPDTAAAYWYTPFTAQDGLHITLSGHYPDARYMSLEVTAPNGGCSPSTG